MKKEPIVITMGDVAGIGPEIIAAAYLRHPHLMLESFVAGDVAHMRRAAQLVTQSKGFLPIVVIEHPAEVFDLTFPCLPVLQATVGASNLVSYGKAQAAAGQMAGECIAWATHAALEGQVRGLVTSPICKEAFHMAGAPYDQFPGHTEFLQQLCARYYHQSIKAMPVRMMLFNSSLRVVLVSIHMPLLKAIEYLSIEHIDITIAITHHALSQHLGRPPRIAVAGLNPHAGEGGMFGMEESAIIAPACALAQQKGWNVSGPHAPDTIFSRARCDTRHPDAPCEFDLVIAMYHDQGLIPIKYLGIDDGVNVTLGLPIRRASPDHGTAFDIAGTNRAGPDSLLAAMAWIK